MRISKAPIGLAAGLFALAGGAMAQQTSSDGTAATTKPAMSGKHTTSTL